MCFVCFQIEHTSCFGAKYADIPEINSVDIFLSNEIEILDQLPSLNIRLICENNSDNLPYIPSLLFILCLFKMFDKLYNVDDVDAAVGGRAKILLPQFIGHNYSSHQFVRHQNTHSNHISPAIASSYERPCYNCQVDLSLSYVCGATTHIVILGNLLVNLIKNFVSGKKCSVLPEMARTLITNYKQN